MLDRLIADQARQATDQLRGQLLFGRVSRAPATVNDDLFVVIPQLDPRFERGPAVWTPRGASIPTPGAACLVTLDDRGRPWVAAWEGPVTGGGAPSGPAGGVLSGSYPDPGFAVDMATQAELDTHTGLTTGAHGGIVASTDPRLTDSRTPTGAAGGDLSGTYPNPQIASGAVVNADVNAAAAIAESKLALASDAAAGTASRRTLGTGGTQACAGNDSRLSNARTPTGTAGGVLAGTYPNPTFASDMATQAELNAVAALLGGTQIIGPFDPGVGATVGQYAEATLTVTHNLGLAGAQTIVGQLYDGGFAAGFSWRTSNVTSNSFQITLMNLRNGNGSAGWKGYVLIG